MLVNSTVLERWRTSTCRIGKCFFTIEKPAGWLETRFVILVLQSLSCVWLFATLWTVAHQASLWDFPGKNTGASCHFLLQGIFPTRGSNPHLLHWQVGSLPLSHLGSSTYTEFLKTCSSRFENTLFSPLTFLNHLTNSTCPKWPTEFEG